MHFVLTLATALVVFPIAAAVAADLPATATTSVVAKRGATLRDVNASRLGTIDRLNSDGSVQIIYNSHFVTIPADKLVAGTDGVSTSLTKAEVSKLR